MELRHSYIKQYLPDNTTDNNERESGAIGPAMETEEGETNPGRQRYVTARRRMNNANIRAKGGLIRPNEKMRITKAGLCFSGPTAYPSNMFYASVTFQKKDYKSNEQAFQFTEASTHDKPDLAASLKAMTNSYEIKVESNNTVVTDGWSEKALDILWDLLEEKMKEHSELLEQLIDTAPLRLIKASTSMRWRGGGGPF